MLILARMGDMPHVMPLDLAEQTGINQLLLKCLFGGVLRRTCRRKALIEYLAQVLPFFRG